MIKESLQELRKKMKAEGIDIYLVFSDDFHGSEYVGDYFRCREYISGFTGSAGSVAITQEMAGLWTDGRYFLQAEKQLDRTSFQLFRTGEPGVKSLVEFVLEQLKRSQCVGFDGRTASAAFVEELDQRLAGKEISFKTSHDLIGDIWQNRPALTGQPVFNLATCYSGISRQEKLSAVRGQMNRYQADILLLSALDEIAWLLNLRGADIKYCPVFLAYAVITKDGGIVFGQEALFSEEIKDILTAVGMVLKPYDEIYQYLQQLPAGCLWADKNHVNWALWECIPDRIEKLDRDSPILRLKAVKNETEINNQRHAHLKDGIAITKFLYWLSLHIGQGEITELSAAQRLEEFRQAQDLYQGPSFAPIFAYGAHGAIVHYSADKDSNASLTGSGLLLMDTGGHYLDGTTDITRTIALGTLTGQQKSRYTAVLRGNLRLGAAKFRYGCRGINLDALARQPLWDQGLDYNHGTGHGVGFLLNVHEGPNRIRWQSESIKEQAVLEPGMITSNEPGYYQAEAYGIRLENLILCKNWQQNEYGRFMEFETLTLVPFDRNCIAPEEMNDQELSLLNAYHQQVYQKLAPHLQPEEELWLREATKEMKRF